MEKVFSPQDDIRFHVWFNIRNHFIRTLYGWIAEPQVQQWLPFHTIEFPVPPKATARNIYFLAMAKNIKI